VTVNDTVEIRIAAHLWPRWARIGIDGALTARRARSRAGQATTPAAGSAALDEEFDASLIAVAASAAALEALCGSLVVRDVVRGQKLGESQPAKIREALKRVFVSRPFNDGWTRELDWLYDLRDPAIHHREEPQKTVPHPSLEYIHYSTESADKAVQLMLEVLRWCVDNPKPAVRNARAWAEANRPVVVNLESRWQQA
jgi:hypothetical protein